MVADVRAFREVCSVAALLGFCVVPSASQAQDATWSTTPANGIYNSGANWSTGTVPTGTASFGQSSMTNLLLGQTQVGGWTFNAGPYTFSNNLALSFAGAGIINNGGSATITNSGFVQFFGTSTAGSAAIINNGFLNFNNTSTAGSAAITNNVGGTTQFFVSSTAGNAAITNNGGALVFNTNSTADHSTITNNGGGTVNFLNSSTADSAVIANVRGSLVFNNTSTAGSAKITSTPFGATQFLGNSTAGNAAITNSGPLEFRNASTAGSATITNSGFTQFFNSSTADNAVITNNAGGFLNFQDSSTAGSATITNNGDMNFFGSSNAGIATITTGAGATTRFLSSVSGLGRFITNAGGTMDISGMAVGLSAGSIEGAGTFVLGAKQLTVGFNNLSTNVSGTISGVGGSLIKVGSGTLTLSGANTYTGGANGFGTTVGAGTLLVNGSLASGVIVNNGATLGGTGTIAGPVFNAGTLAPGNSIGTLTVNGSYTQAAGSTYQVEVNAAGQNDRINIAGAPGTATINGGTVQVLAQPGSYGKSTTYTILNATGGRTGTYNGVTSDFEFFQPSLTYDPNNVFLTLALSFTQIPGETPNEGAVGGALDQIINNAGGDTATVINVLAGLRRGQGRAVLDALSGQPWADFGTMNVNNSAMFMNAIGQQMALARGGAAASGQRLALAQACEVGACEGASRFSVWGSLLGGLGSVLGDDNGFTLTYNFGGAAAGIDYRINPSFLVGISAGYTHGTEWVNSLLGQGWSDAASVALYGSFTQGPVYVDALAGYAYFGNQLQRQIVIPGLLARTANGSTGANTFLGQVEAGYKVDVYAPAQASITPFGRLQLANVNQNALTETGAGAISLNVAQQTTNSVRSVLGADFGAAVPLGSERKLDLALRLGWQHEFAYTGRPITAAFSGAPSASFTVYGATPRRDSAVLGLSASTTIAEATQVYLRYDGEIASGTDNHALNVGVRFSW